MSWFEEKTRGFERQADALRAASAAGRLAHAYLLHGDDEGLRESAALALAAIAACPAADSRGIPCGECSVCRQIESRAYPELFVLAPVSKSRQIRIGKDDRDEGTMRWFLERLSMTSTAPGMRKIGVIFDADRMGPGAQNAFLKTLEEPPDKTILILATANPAALLPTIISRCHVVSILTNRVEYGFPGVDEAAEALARLGSCAAGGGLRAAMESAEELIGVLDALEEKAEENVRASWERRLEKLEEFIATLSPSERKTRKDALKDACDAAVKGEQVKLLSELLSFVHAWFAQLYQISLGVDPAEIANPEIYRHFDARKLVRDPRAAGRALARAEKLIDDLRWNVNRKLAVSAFCCSFVEDAVDKRAG